MLKIYLVRTLSGSYLTNPTPHRHFEGPNVREFKDMKSFLRDYEKRYGDRRSVIEISGRMPGKDVGEIVEVLRRSGIGIEDILQNGRSLLDKVSVN